MKQFCTNPTSSTYLRSRVIAAIVVAIVLGGFAFTTSGLAMYWQEDERPKQKVTRAKKPQFDKRDWETTFFEDLFREGLVGQRPADFGSNREAVADSGNNSESSSSGSGATFAWSQLIDSSVLEDEVKRRQLELNSNITSSAKFNSDYRNAKKSFSMLSMLFAIIHEYDQDVRWQNHSLNAQVAFYRAASFPSNKLTEAYEFSKARRDSLTEMVRGSGFPEEESAGDAIDWESVCDRSPVMQHLDEILYENLKAWVSNESEFKTNKSDIIHQAQLIAVMGKILATEGLDDADDEDYQALAMEMVQAATDAAAAARNDNYEFAAKAVNLIDQSCINCHDDWR